MGWLFKFSLVDDSSGSSFRPCVCPCSHGSTSVFVHVTKCPPSILSAVLSHVFVLIEQIQNLQAIKGSQFMVQYLRQTSEVHFKNNSHMPLRSQEDTAIVFF